MDPLPPSQDVQSLIGRLVTDDWQAARDELVAIGEPAIGALLATMAARDREEYDEADREVGRPSSCATAC